MACFRNYYDCPCGTNWWSDDLYTCDDRCPSCNLSCSPTESEDLPGGEDDES